MEERQSRLSSMVWRRLRPYFCVRLILLNSMFSNFCHVLKPHTINLSKGNIEFITRVTHQRIKGVFIDRQITQPLHLLHLRKQPAVHFRNSSPLGLLFNSLCQRSRGILFAFSHHIDNQCVVLRHFRSNQFVNHYFIGTVSFGLILLEIPELR